MDLEPEAIWPGWKTGLEAWDRAVKFYDNLKFVYQIQTTLREWQQQDEEQRPVKSRKTGATTDEHKLPVKSAPGETPSNASGRKSRQGTTMNCQNHPETPATAYCRACGKPVCDECRRDTFGTSLLRGALPRAAPRRRRRHPIRAP